MKKHFFAALFLLPFTSFGAGYQLNLQGLRQLAMGGTGTGWVWDASTMFYNPAGLTRLKGIQIYGSGLVIAPSTAYGNQENSGSESTSLRTQSRTFMPFNLYVGGPVQQDSKFALGLGIYTAAGIGVTWDDNWIGKYIVQSTDVKAVFFQPTLAYRVSDFLSVGGGFIYANGSLDMRQALNTHGLKGSNEDDGEAHLHGNTNGVGYNLGVHLKAGDHMQIGLTYRSQVNMSLAGGAATFDVPKSLQASFPNTQFDTQLPLPQVASIGLGYRFGENLTLQFDLNYTGWNSFDSLRVNFAEHTSAVQDIRAPRHYKNTLTPRLGGNYKISRVVSVMLGGAYDRTPVTDGYVSPDLPDADRIVVSGGISIKPLRRFTILAAFEGISSVKRSGSYDFAPFQGSYKTEVATTGIGVYYNF